MALGYAASSALQVAERLEIADRLAGGPQPVEDLAGTTPDMGTLIDLEMLLPGGRERTAEEFARCSTKPGSPSHASSRTRHH